MITLPKSTHMKALLTFLVATGLAFSLQAQEVQQVPLIEVQGYSVKSVSPDEAVFFINLEEKSMKVTDATKILNTKTENLANQLKKSKIRDYKLVADNYSVNINRIYRSGVSRDSGYVARQSLQIITKTTNEDLQKISDAIQVAGDMSFNLSFRVSEATTKSMENTLMREALLDAQSKANLIAETLGIRTIRVFHVSLDQPASPLPVMRMMADGAQAESAKMMIAPDGQKIEKRVYVKFTY
jgi:uncharacterized protein YggE